MKNGGTKGQKHTKTQYPFTRMYLDPKYLENPEIPRIYLSRCPDL